MLDASTRIDVLNLLGDLKSRGLGVLFITHDLSLGNYISDRTVILRRGQRRRGRHHRAGLRKPLHPYTRSLLASVLLAAHEVEGHRDRARPGPTDADVDASSPADDGVLVGSSPVISSGRRTRARTDLRTSMHDAAVEVGRTLGGAAAANAWWRSSRNPIIARNHIPARTASSTRRSCLRRRVRRVFRVDDTARTMNLHAGRSADGIAWEIDHEPIAFVPSGRPRPRDPGPVPSPTTRASPGSRIATT